MRKVVVIGVGMTKFGKFPEMTVEQLGREAAWAAIKDAGIGPKDIQVAYLGNLTERRETGHNSCVAQEILMGVGIRGIPITRVENACSSGSTAVREAWMAVGSGLYDIAMALGVEKLTGRGPAPLSRIGDTLEGIAGFSPPGMWAMRAQKAYGAIRDNPGADGQSGGQEPEARSFESPGSISQRGDRCQEVRNSPMICNPLTLFDSCPTTDGGAAAILCSEEVAKRYTTKFIYVAAATLKSGNL